MIWNTKFSLFYLEIVLMFIFLFACIYLYTWPVWKVSDPKGFYFSSVVAFCILHLYTQSETLSMTPSFSEEIARSYVWKVEKLSNNWNSMFRQESLNLVRWMNWSIDGSYDTWSILWIVHFENHQALTKFRRVNEGNNGSTKCE